LAGFVSLAPTHDPSAPTGAAAVPGGASALTRFRPMTCTPASRVDGCESMALKKACAVCLIFAF
jgi:hypothetical protein